jgi:uncharacterized protein YkwD
MAIATKPKPKSTSHKKRTGTHHKQTKQYHKSYWPYIPLLLIVGLGMLTNSFMSHPRAVLGWEQQLNQEALLLETNNDRRSHARQALSLDQQLNAAAQKKANDMVQKDYWSHTSPSGQQPWQFIIDSGYQYQAAGENLAYGFTSADSVLNGWMKSQEHRNNLLDASYTEVGFGVAQARDFQGKGSQVVVVAMYGLPSSQPNVAGVSDGAGWDASSPISEQVAVSRVASISPTLNGILVGVIGTLAVIAVLFRHAIAWRKLIRRGEKFIIKHPLLDMTLVAIAIVSGLLLQTAGFVG